MTAGAPRTVAITVPTIPLRIRIGILVRMLDRAILASIRRSILISNPIQILASTAIPIAVACGFRSPSPHPT